MAIVIGGLLMIWLSGHVTEFLKKNRMYEVLGLFILLIVGVMLLSEGAHFCSHAYIQQRHYRNEQSTFYFVIVVLILIDIVQSRYQKKINRGLD